MTVDAPLSSTSALVHPSSFQRSTRWHLQCVPCSFERTTNSIATLSSVCLSLATLLLCSPQQEVYFVHLSTLPIPLLLYQAFAFPWRLHFFVLLNEERRPSHCKSCAPGLCAAVEVGYAFPLRWLVFTAIMMCPGCYYLFANCKWKPKFCAHLACYHPHAWLLLFQIWSWPLLFGLLHRPMHCVTDGVRIFRVTPRLHIRIL